MEGFVIPEGVMSNDGFHVICGTLLLLESTWSETNLRIRPNAVICFFLSGSALMNMEGQREKAKTEKLTIQKVKYK